MIKKNSEKKKKNSENQDYGDFFNMIRKISKTPGRCHT